MLQTFLIVRSKNGIYILKTIWFVVSERQRETEKHRFKND